MNETRANPHIRHLDVHEPGRFAVSGPWFCCARVQLGGVGMDECNECGEPWPCPTARQEPPGADT